jgi:hypothetical protein
MPRRLLALLALIGALTVIACQGSPAAPALSDPKDILAKTVLSLKDVKTLQIKGDLTGTVQVPNSGALDLKGTTASLDADIAAKTIHVTVSAPSFLGTTAEAILIDKVAYYKLTGPLAGMVGADATGKFKKVDMPEASGDPGQIASDPNKAIDEFKAQLDKLPTPPTKAADEKCGDQDCYHIVLKVTDKDLAAMSSSAPDSTMPVTVTIDVWSRKNDLRPAKLAIGIDAGAQGSGTLTFTITYDQAVSISAPPADQIAP